MMSFPTPPFHFRILYRQFFGRLLRLCATQALYISLFVCLFVVLIPSLSISSFVFRADFEWSIGVHGYLTSPHLT